jgi:SAM-dependent methyltransferase
VVTLAVELALTPDEARAALADELALAGLEGVEPKIEPVEGGTRVTLELRPDLELIGDGGRELAGWLVSLAARAASTEALGDWVTDRRARRPSGAWAREVYADPIYHRPNFLAILAELSLTPDDVLLEVGCGGGAFLREALRSGCRAAGIDHSPDMVGWRGTRTLGRSRRGGWRSSRATPPRCRSPKVPSPPR